MFKPIVYSYKHHIIFWKTKTKWQQQRNFFFLQWNNTTSLFGLYLDKRTMRNQPGAFHLLCDWSTPIMYFSLTLPLDLGALDYPAHRVALPSSPWLAGFAQLERLPAVVLLQEHHYCARKGRTKKSFLYFHFWTLKKNRIKQFLI